MYSRFNVLPGYGKDELEKLKDSKVGIIGLGATGSVIAENLGRHGINLFIVDRDYLETKDVYSSNIYTTRDCRENLPKALAASKYLEDFTEVEFKVANLSPGNISCLEDCDLIIDGTDNMETRFILNEFSKKKEIPWIYTSAIGDKGYSMFFKNKCFNCVFEEISAGSLETCETTGILREISTIIGAMSSKKAVRYLSGKKVSEKLDTAEGSGFEVESSGCRVCQERCFDRLNSNEKTVSVCGKDKYQLKKRVGSDAFDKLKDQCSKVIADNEYLLRVELKGREFTLFKSGRAIIEAEDKGHAEAVFSETVGL